MTWLTSSSVPHWSFMDQAFISVANVFLDRMNPSSVVVTSSFRTPEENRRVGGVSDSRHLVGQAVDLVLTGCSHLQVPGAVQGLPLKVIFYPDKNYYHVQSSSNTAALQYGITDEGGTIGFTEIGVVILVGVLGLVFLLK